MSSNIQEVRRELEQLRQTIRETQRDMLIYKNTASDILRLVQRMGLPESVKRQVAEVQRLIGMLNSLIMAYRAVQIARMAAGDPIAWIQAGVEVTGTIVSVGAMFENETRGR